MYILDIIKYCNSPALSSFLSITKNILLFIQLIVPIILIVMSVIELTRLSINPEDKKGFRKILNKIIAAFIVFMIPILINAVMGLVGESTEFSRCWNNAGDISINNDNYIEIEEENEGKINIWSDD